ncbi:MAG: NifB/NifX family molybdenum-iron cluster-binding protein [Desulfobacterales bacterium]
MDKVAVTCEAPSLDAQVDPRFGRAAGFLIVDPETMEFEYIDNGSTQVMAQGAGIQAAENVSNSGAKVLLTGYVGPKAFQGLRRCRHQDRPEPDSMTAARPLKNSRLARSNLRKPQTRKAPEMKIAVASGKGGTGKTTHRPLCICMGLAGDCHGSGCGRAQSSPFLNPVPPAAASARMEIRKWTRPCAPFAENAAILPFKAISLMGKCSRHFRKCHGCGGCLHICPENALHHIHRGVGEIARGHAGETEFLMGCLRIGAASPPLMRQVKNGWMKCRPHPRTILGMSSRTRHPGFLPGHQRGHGTAM